MTFDELKQHAEENDLAVRADTLRTGELAVLLCWGDWGAEWEGALVVRGKGIDHALIVVTSGKAGAARPGSHWGSDSLTEITVMKLNPELPYEVAA